MTGHTCKVNGGPESLNLTTYIFRRVFITALVMMSSHQLSSRIWSTSKPLRARAVLSRSLAAIAFFAPIMYIHDLLASTFSSGHRSLHTIWIAYSPSYWPLTVSHRSQASGPLRGSDSKSTCSLPFFARSSLRRVAAIRRVISIS